MKLSVDSLARLDLLVQTAMIGNIKKLIIEQNQIRGIDEKQLVVIITDQNVPDFEGKSVGINRLEQLNARLSLIKSQGDLEVEATVSPNGADISIFDLKSGKATAQFRCASTESVKGVPKKISDTLVWKITIDSKIVPTIIQASSAMATDFLTIASRNGKSVSIEFIDSNKDVFTMECEQPAEWIGSGAAATSFCQKYQVKILIALIKEALKLSPTVELKLGEGGIMSINVNGFDFYVIPSQ